MRKRIVKIMIILILVIIGIFVGNFAYNKFNKYKFQKILEESDAKNYELIQFSNDEEINVWVRDKKLLSVDGNITTWVDELSASRIVMDTESNIAIITNKDYELKVNSLNYTYLENYFNNSDEKFKYKGKEENDYVLEFTNTKTKIITLLYLNCQNNIIEKMSTISNGIGFDVKFDVKVDAVSKKEVEKPDLTDYHIQDSVSSSLLK